MELIIGAPPILEVCPIISALERISHNACAESLRLSVIQVPSGRVLWTDDHAVEGGGCKPGFLDRALDTLLAHMPRRP